MNTERFELTPDELNECYKEWPQDENLTLFQLVARRIATKVQSFYEPVELEALEDEEIYVAVKGKPASEEGKIISQATIQKNQAKGQLFRLKE